MVPLLRVTIIGAGAVGMTFAATLAAAGVGVTLLVRKDAIASWDDKDLQVTGVVGTHAIPAGTFTLDDAFDPADASLACDVLVVATKAYQVSDVLRPMAARLATRSSAPVVLLLQNGWGSADEAYALLSVGAAVYTSVMMIGIERRAACHVNVNVLAGPVRIGAAPGGGAAALGPFMEAAARGFLPMVYEDPIEATILNKFLFNTCLNATGAMTGQTYGELVTHASSRALITRIADEALRVLDAARGYRPAPSGKAYLEDTLTPFVIPKASAHRSSMLQDISAGRTTEIDYLNGAIVRMGQAHGIDTPLNEEIVWIVHARESAGR